ncbi:MAG: hypothetical protein C0407_11290 [Desulfobacca sp.]|nr:hypothetical protein [Desulfobacca sp.]
MLSAHCLNDKEFLESEITKLDLKCQLINQSAVFRNYSKLPFQFYKSVGCPLSRHSGKGSCNVKEWVSQSEKPILI